MERLKYFLCIPIRLVVLGVTLVILVILRPIAKHVPITLSDTLLYWYFWSVDQPTD